MSHKITNHEKQRIEAVRALSILDTAPEERFDRFTRVTKHLFNVPHAFISIVDRDRQWFKSTVGMDVTETPRAISFCTHAIKEPGVMVVPDATQDDRFKDNPFVTGAPGLRFYAGCPLHEANGFRVGTLCITDTKPRTFTKEEEGLLQDMASMAEQELATMQLATLDELTNLSNRRGFLHLANHPVEFCHRLGLSGSLMLFDIDNLKPINDTHGHVAGDEVLKSFASMLARSLRETDACGRLGGDEFVAFLPGIDAGQADAVINRLREQVTEANDNRDHAYDIQFSVGSVSRGSHERMDIEQMLKEADALMYKQKRKRKRR